MSFFSVVSVFSVVKPAIPGVAASVVRFPLSAHESQYASGNRNRATQLNAADPVFFTRLLRMGAIASAIGHG